MKIKVMLLVAVLLLASVSMLTVTHESSTDISEMSHANDFRVGGTGALDWNGSFPHNYQASPLAERMKLSSSAVGDINNDGLPDVILASYLSSNVSVHLNYGGNISVRSDYYIDSADGVYNVSYVSVVNEHIAVACEDYTSTTINDNNKIKIYSYGSTAPITLDPPTFSGGITANVALESLVVGDFNDDGQDDLAAAFSSYSTNLQNASVIAIYDYPFSDGQTPDKTIKVGNNITYLAAGDFNHDSQDDIAVITDDDTRVAVFYQNSGNFNNNDATYISVNSPAYLYAGDLNGDGYDDLAVSSPADGKVYVYYSTASGLPASPSVSLSVGAGALAITAGDFNHDSTTDLLVSRADSRISGFDSPNFLEIFNGPFVNSENPSRLIFGGYAVSQLWSADFNNDGYEDVLSFAVGATSDFPSLPFVLYQRDGYLKGISDSTLYGGYLPTGIGVADFNGDGYPDVMLSESGLNRTALFLNQGYGFYPLQNATFSVYGNPYMIATGHFNGDSTMDFAVTHFSDGNITIHLSSGNINLTTPMNSTRQIAVDDLNSDGVPDLVATGVNDTAGAIYAFYGNFEDAQAPNSTLNFTAKPLDMQKISVGGNPDLAVMFASNISIFNYTTEFNANTTILPDSGYQFTGFSVADFNGDGLEDIIAAEGSGTTSRYVLYLQTYDGFARDLSGALPGRASHVAAGDFNDDGISDFAVSVPSGAIVIEYFNGSAFSKDYVASEQSPSYLLAADLNGDGKSDLIESCTGPLVDYGRKEIGVLNIYYQKDFPPVANISAPSEIYEGKYLNLSGANSTDGVADANTLNYTWYNWTGSAWSLIGYGVKISYFVPTQGNYSFKLVVRDKECLSNFTTFNVTALDTKPVVDFIYYNAVEGQNTTFIAHIYAYDGIYQILWDMNDDGKWDFVNKTEVNYTYPQQGNYHVNLTVIDGDGSVGYVNKTISIADTSPVVDFKYSPLVIYEGELVNFTDESTSYDPMVNWTWHFSTGAVKYGRNVSYVFPNNGTYVVNLTVRDSDGSLSWNEKTLQVLDTEPVVNFTYIGEYEGQEFHFYPHVVSHDAIASYFWDFGDGNTSSAELPIHVFTKSGTYKVTLWVNDSDGSNVSYYREVSVKNSKPVVNFTFTSNAVEGRPVEFNATVRSFDGIAYILWDFGDGKVLNLTNLSDAYAGNGTYFINETHTYVQNGTYSVSVYVRERDGDEAEFSRVVYVQDTAPVVHLKLDTTGKIVEDETIRLNASGSTAYDGIKLYYWDFTYYEGHFIADEKTTTPYATTRYAEMGTYTIAVRVVDNDGSITTAFINVTVVNLPPIANFSYYVDKNEIVVNASSSEDTPSDLPTLNYTWHFGDGSVGYGKITTHRYNETGAYKVVLTVRDNDGATSNYTKIIHIKVVPPPQSGKSPISAFPWFLWILIIATILVAIAFVIVMRKEKLTIDDVYLIDDSGTLIHHATRRLNPNMDEDILSSMLVAIQEFVKDAFKGEDNVTLKSMEFGDKKINIHKGKHLILATISSAKLSKKLEEKAKEVLSEIEEKYKDVIENWDGDVSAFRGVGEILRKLWD